jgi:hypothetical protein
MILDNIFTLDELQNFLEVNCYNLDFFSTSQKSTNDSFGIEIERGLFSIFYYERGKKDILHYFSTEADTVNYVKKNIITDKMAKSHYYGTFSDPIEIANIHESLSEAKINFWHDQIPFLGINNTAMRFFILGCDIKKVKTSKIDE